MICHHMHNLDKIINPDQCKKKDEDTLCLTTCDCIKIVFAHAIN